MIKIKESGKFQLIYKQLIIDNPQIGETVASQVKLFRHNPDDTRLKNHALQRSMTGKWAFSITDDIRIVYKWQGKNVVRFLTIGTHSSVYSRER